MTWQPEERWPPAYDADDLNLAIQQLARPADDQAYSFFDSPKRGPDYCQGDVLHLDADLPCLDRTGAPAKLDRLGNVYWLVLGNTCDFDRSLDEFPYTQIVPIDVIRRSDLTAGTLAGLQQYDATRRFLVPQWPGCPARDVILIADLMRPVTTHKDGIANSAAVVARMSRHGWALFHACIIRFLARDDGRFDPD